MFFHFKNPSFYHTALVSMSLAQKKTKELVFDNISGLESIPHINYFTQK